MFKMSSIQDILTIIISSLYKILNTYNGKLKPRLFSLSSSPEMITAISNDISDVEIFSKQLEMLAKSGDVLIVISCSGNSQNINNAIKFAKKFGLKMECCTQ